MPQAREGLWFAAVVLAVAAAALPGATGAPPSKIVLPAGSAFNCKTKGRPGTCAKMDRKDASWSVIDALDIGVLSNYLQESQAQTFLKAIKEIPKDDWVKIDNKETRKYGNNGKAYKASVDMSYEYYDLQHQDHLSLRRLLEPVFTDLFQGPGQKLSMFVGKYSEGSYVTAHTDGGVVTFDGTDRYERKRAFLLYLNEEWEMSEGGLFTDEEDAGKPGYTPGWNTVLHFRVPRWHLVTPVKSPKTRWSVYGWAVDPVVPFPMRVLKAVREAGAGLQVVLVLGLFLLCAAAFTILRKGFRPGGSGKKE
eukprot:CAMPEP_0180350828 /NCGR_PEP_ID=MMETSP0989-20121125/6200_1 /TAXON_ID=697907 /ORGANISM="non described non described, Strain CCMP2293" /LENGTH=306 /DNA_ID=CAMNT_0022340223 /DNA_START=18 /DNA_END=938 /DNA_ORIENTATION=+